MGCPAINNFLDAIRKMDISCLIKLYLSQYLVVSSKGYDKEFAKAAQALKSQLPEAIQDLIEQANVFERMLWAVDQSDSGISPGVCELTAIRKCSGVLLSEFESETVKECIGKFNKLWHEHF